MISNRPGGDLTSESTLFAFFSEYPNSNRIAFVACKFCLLNSPKRLLFSGILISEKSEGPIDTPGFACKKLSLVCS